MVQLEFTLLWLTLAKVWDSRRTGIADIYEKVVAPPPGGS
jgi:hypothetical protein